MALAVLVATLTLLATGCSSTGSSRPAPGPSVGQQLDRPIPPSVQAVPLTDSAGRATTLAHLLGKIVVISDMLTLCQGTCPVDTANVVGAARQAEADGLTSRVAFLSITVDPERDTGPRLAAYRTLYGPAPPDWFVLTGQPAGINELWNALGVFRQRVPDQQPAPKDWLTGRPLTYDITHSDEVFFLDESGKERFLLEGAPHISPGSPVPSALQSFQNGDDGPTSSPTGWTTEQATQVLSWLLQS